LFVDPDNLSAINVTGITQTSATVSWSIGETKVVNATTLYFSDTSTTAWNETSVTGTEHSVTSLQPGTEYQFFAKINSYGKTSTSENITATTGMVS